MSDQIYVLGHRRPDCDSIAAALGYAELKQHLTDEPVVAGRVGEPNPETRFALETFGVEPPLLVRDLRLRVKDIMHKDAPSVSPGTVFFEAARLMHEHHLKILPIDADGRLAGIVSIGDLAEKYVSVGSRGALPGPTAVGNLVTALDGKLLAGDPGASVSGRIVTAAMSRKTMIKYISPGDIVLVGDRPEAQAAAIAAGAACLVVTGGLPVSPAALEAADRQGAAIISVDLDTYSASRRVEMAVDVSAVMRRGVVTFATEDLISEARQVAGDTRHHNYPVIDEEGLLVGVVSRADLAGAGRRRVILVDHNSREEAVPGIEEAEVLEIIDHHRLADIQTSGPIYFRLEPVGSSSTIVTGMFLEHGLQPSRGRAGLLLSAILSDTLMFKSPTCTPRDRAMAEALAEIAGVNWREYGLDLLRAGAHLSGMTARDLITMDYKVFPFRNHRLGVGQFNAFDLSEVLSRQDELLTEMEGLRVESGLNAVLVMATDPIREASQVLYTIPDPKLAAALVDQSRTAGSVRMDGMVSRKKQMVPLLSRAIDTVTGAA